MFASQLLSSSSVYRVAVVVVMIVSVLTLASLFGHHVYLELATHFRLQYALLSVCAILLLINFQSWKLLALAACCALLNSLFILPYYSRDVAIAFKETTQLRLMQANLQGSNKNYDAIRASIASAQADVLVLQELTEGCWNQLEDLKTEFPYLKAAPRPGGSGMALLSRFPLEAAEVLAMDQSTHIALWVRVNVQGTPISILALHPPTPVRTDKFNNRNQQFARAAALLKSTSGVRILIGDLNTTMWSPYFADLIRESGLRDVRKGFGLNCSWPLPLPSFLQIPIDHCLVSDDVVVAGVTTGKRTGSDHRPLVVSLRLKQASLN
jgi:endonuclease/exonuclease/phosphatase (EEP) superfamily protein YafD